MIIENNNKFYYLIIIIKKPNYKKIIKLYIDKYFYLILNKKRYIVE